MILVTIAVHEPDANMGSFPPYDLARLFRAIDKYQVEPVGYIRERIDLQLGATIGKIADYALDN